MLAKAIESIVALGRASNAVQLTTLPDGRFIVKHADTMEENPRPPLEPDSLMYTLGDFVNAAHDTVLAPDPEVYYHGTGAVLICERRDRHARITMQLDRTERFATLEDIDAKGGLSKSAPELVRFLRFKLGNTRIDELVQSLRKVEFTRRSDGSSDIAHGKESLGRNVEAAIQQADTIPDQFVCTVPVFPGFPSLCQVTLGVHIDLQNELITICPLADEIATALEDACKRLGETLGEALGGLVPLFYGAPGARPRA